MRLRSVLAAVSTLAALALGSAGCGDEEETTTTVPSASTTTTSTTSSPTQSTSSSTSTTQSTTSTTSTVTESTGATTTAPEVDIEQPDSETNDKPPKPGSPEEAFEQACEADPEACG